MKEELNIIEEAGCQDSKDSDKHDSPIKKKEPWA
jgi:hypothetical protein